jgi:hypothetical protein
MATITDPSVEELNRQSARLEAEARKLMAEAGKLNAEEYKLAAERYKFDAERLKLDSDRELLPRSMIFQAMTAFAAVLVAGAAIAKLFFP